MLLLLRGGSAPVRAGFRRIRRRVLGGFDGGSGPFKKLRAWSLKPPRGAETPPGPGFAWGLLRGGGPAVTWGGSSADPGARPNSRRGEIFRPPGRTDGRDARTRPRRLMGAPRARGRPSRALPHGLSPRPVVPPPPLRQPWPWGREAPSFAPADGRSSGPFFGASLRGLPPSTPPSLPPSLSPSPGWSGGAWQRPPRGKCPAGRGAGQLSHDRNGRRSVDSNSSVAKNSFSLPLVHPSSLVSLAVSHGQPVRLRFHLLKYSMCTLSIDEAVNPGSLGMD